MKHQAFLDAVVKEVEKEYPDVNIGSDGLTIHTTLDQDAQDYADKIMDGNLIKYPDDQFQGSFVFMDTQSEKFEQLVLDVKKVSLLSKVIIWQLI